MSGQTQYPMMLYRKAEASEFVPPFSLNIVNSDEQLKDALDCGWFMTVPEALAGDTDRDQEPKKKARKQDTEG